WLPLLLVESAGLDVSGASAVLSMFAALGLPAGIVVPLLANRLRRLAGFTLICIAAFTVGYMGILIAPEGLAWLWVVMAGIGQFLFPLVIVLIGLRSRSQSLSLLASGLVQGVGYTLGAAGPLVVGFLHETSGGWNAPLLFLMLVTFILGVGASFILDR